MKRRASHLPLIIYLLNATLLLCHEIDSAYWQEWKLFRLPGGPEGFVALHIALVGVVLWGLIVVDRGRPAWRWFSLLLGLSGVIGGSVHSAFLIAGNEFFSSPFSVALIMAFTLTSAMQLVVTSVWWRQPIGRQASEKEDCT